MAAVTFHRLSSTYDLRQVEGVHLSHVSIENKSLLATNFMLLLSKSTPLHISVVKCNNVAVNHLCELVQKCESVTTIELPKKIKNIEDPDPIFYQLFQSNINLKSLTHNGKVVDRKSFLSDYMPPKNLVKIENEKQVNKDENAVKINQQESLEEGKDPDEFCESSFSKPFSCEIDLNGGHKRGVWALQIIDDKIYSGSYDGKVSVWDSEGTLINAFKAHKAQVLSLASNDQGQLITGSADHEVRLWGPSGYTKLFYHPYGVYGMCALPNQNLAFSSCQIPKGQSNWEYQIRIGNISNQALSHTLKGHRGAIAELKYLSSGDLISASADQTIGVWNISTGVLKKQLKTHTNYVYSCENVDDNLIIGGSKDKSISIWDAQSLNLVEKISEAHESTIYSVKNLGNHLIASGSRDMTVKIWDLRNYKLLQSIECRAFVYRVEKLNSSTIVAGLAAPEEMADGKIHKNPGESLKTNLKILRFN